MPDLESARAEILGRIADAAARSGRAPDDVRVVAVSKTVDATRIAAAAAAGWATFGENRVQERAAKAPDLAGVRAEWHLVGPLQSNKAKRAIETFDVIESVDSVELAVRLSRIAIELDRAPLPILLQVNVDADPAKAGFTPDVVAASLAELLGLGGLRIDGLMTVGRLVTDPGAARPTFVALRALAERLRSAHSGLGPALSMGMSDDFEVAVEEGATHVRVGRALFGARPTAKV